MPRMDLDDYYIVEQPPGRLAMQDKLIYVKMFCINICYDA